MGCQCMPTQSHKYKKSDFSNYKQCQRICQCVFYKASPNSDSCSYDEKISKEQKQTEWSNWMLIWQEIGEKGCFEGRIILSWNP